ncbi:MAG: MBL fold metallo-hydrolase [Anaerolineaceae bacterium]|nr:MBL fold metallo-hydrolase [Anaerolineaceae bacterium]
MDPTIITIPLKVPCYLIKIRDSYIMIDTGEASDCAHLEKELDHAVVTHENLKLVILTHGDFDHAGNAAYLQKKYAVKIAIHAGDLGMVEHGDQGWNRKVKSDRTSFFGRVIIFISSHLSKSVHFNSFKPDILLVDGQDLSEYGFEAKVLHLPGHSKGSIGILTAGGNLFCGDLLMNIFKPDLHFMIDDLVDFNDSIEKLKKLNIKMIYPGHGKPFPMDQFMKNYR